MREYTIIRRPDVLDWEKIPALQMDLLYINDMSIVTDLKLLLQTAQTVFQKESTEGVKKGQTTAKKD